MTRYLAIIDEADGMFGVAFPDAPGCTAIGETQEEALDNAAEALAEWVADELAAGQLLPSPRSHAELLRDRRSGLGKGSVIAMVPLLLETGRVARANISLDAGLLADIDAAASRRGVTRSAFLAAAAREKIKAGA
jgi:predicted RNase H-like HicB family nuclease